MAKDIHFPSGQGLQTQVEQSSKYLRKEAWHLGSRISLVQASDPFVSCDHCQHYELCHVSSKLIGNGEDLLKAMEETEHLGKPSANNWAA
jgi:hypothetical protein